jgi:hypothetical protein
MHISVTDIRAKTAPYLPTMKRATNIAVDNSPADRQIGSKMWAEGVQQGRPTLQRAKQDELATEGSYRHNLRRELSDA